MVGDGEDRPSQRRPADGIRQLRGHDGDLRRNILSEGLRALLPLTLPQPTVPAQGEGGRGVWSVDDDRGVGGNFRIGHLKNSAGYYCIDLSDARASIRLTDQKFKRTSCFAHVCQNRPKSAETV